MSAASRPLAVGDPVWIRTGQPGSAHEEPGTVVSHRDAAPPPGGSAVAADDDADDGDHRDDCHIVVKYSQSGFQAVVTQRRRVRRMASDGGSRRRRSARRADADVATGGAAAAARGPGKTQARAKATATATAKAVRVTPPPPTEADPAGGSVDQATEASRDGAPGSAPTTKTASRKRRRGGASRAASPAAASAAASPKKAKTASDGGGGGQGDGARRRASPFFAEGGVPAAARASGARGGRKLVLASSDDSDADGPTRTSDGKKKKKTPENKPLESGGKAAEAVPEKGAKGAAQAPRAKKKAKQASSKIAGRGAQAASAGNGTEPPPTKHKAAAPKRKSKAKEGVPERKAATAAERRAIDRKHRDDDHGGNDDSALERADGADQFVIPWTVEYSKSGRATCRTCDERILKGDVRVGHAPLFRGKPGFVVYRHLRCTTFSEAIVTAADVDNHEVLTAEDYDRLAMQVSTSKVTLREEREELDPDELVQQAFAGEMRKAPPGLDATLLPFQLEGFSWMRNQEVAEMQIRGGILADEMGMGKTIQTIATILDNRSLLQHTSPGMKHPPACPDLQRRQTEERLWDQSRRDWRAEMEVLKVPKKIRSRDGGGARAGTLVICPVIALSQWKAEIEKFTEDGALTVGTYHGVDRESAMPREMMMKYDVVLTTYQVLEADFRKMTSPNRVECPNCGQKFKIDKLPIHLKYFCGDTAQRTEAQMRQVRGADRGGGNNRRDRRGRRSGGIDDGTGKKPKGTKKKAMPKQATTKKTEKVFTVKEERKKPAAKNKSAMKKSTPRKKKASTVKKASAQKQLVKTHSKRAVSEDDPNEDRVASETPRATSSRSAARRAASQISLSATEWGLGQGEDSDGEHFDGGDESSDSSSRGSSSDDSDIDSQGSSEDDSSEDSSEDDSGEDSELERAREKQRQALEFARSTKNQPVARRKKQSDAAASKSKQKAKVPIGKSFVKGNRGKPKKFNDDSNENYSSSDSTAEDGADIGVADIDIKALLAKAMAGARNSVLHSVCWWRIILDEAHMIKSRSTSTANAAFSLIGIHRWCLSGTPLQNRVGEFYSLVRFLRLDPMAYYFCRAKDSNCKSLHYRMVGGKCENCGRSAIQHYSHFNKYILNPIQREGYCGDGRRAMFVLKNEVLDKALLRRTKETKAADMGLPPRLVQIKPIKLHPVEEDFYSALYTQTKSSFNDYVESGTLLNNYAHIFDLLIRMRQSVDHPYLVVYSKKNTTSQISLTGEAPAIANGSVVCDLCHEPPTNRVVSTCCGVAFCRSCVLEYMATSNSLAAASSNLTCPSCREAFSIDLQAQVDIEDDSSLCITSAARTGNSHSGLPSLKELKHVATGSILRRINLAEFATSSKIEALTRELVLMRQSSPGSKAIVFSQFVNMLDLIRWRLHSDPYLEDIGLGCRALHGGMNVKARDSCLKDFRENNNVRVLLMSLKAGGVALNLTCANYIYLMDPWWNPAAEMQAVDRTHRLGQYRPIKAVRFIAEDTVEERILQLQEKKRLVFDGTVGRDAGSLTMLTADDMKSLFA